MATKFVTGQMAQRWLTNGHMAQKEPRLKAKKQDPALSQNGSGTPPVTGPPSFPIVKQI